MADMEALELDHRQLNAYSFALLDPLRGSATDMAAWVDFPQYKLVPRGFEAQAAQLPSLVCLRDLDTARHECLIDMMLSKRPSPGVSLCVALLQSHAEADRIVLRGCNLLAPHFPRGGRGLFRFYDPEVLEHLVWMLDERRLADVFGSIDIWALPLRAGWYTLTRPQTPVGALPNFGLRAATWQRIQRIGAICAVLKHDPAWQAEPATWGPRAEALLIRAENHHLRDRGDAIAFALHGLRWHADFDSHPRVRDLLADCNGHPARYARLAGRWQDSDWQVIRRDLDQPSQNHPIPASMKPSSQGVYR